MQALYSSGSVTQYFSRHLTNSTNVNQLLYFFGLPSLYNNQISRMRGRNRCGREIVVHEAIPFDDLREGFDVYHLIFPFLQTTVPLLTNPPCSPLSLQRARIHTLVLFPGRTRDMPPSPRLRPVLVAIWRRQTPCVPTPAAGMLPYALPRHHPATTEMVLCMKSMHSTAENSSRRGMS